MWATVLLKGHLDHLNLGMLRTLVRKNRSLAALDDLSKPALRLPKKARDMATKACSVQDFMLPSSSRKCPKIRMVVRLCHCVPTRTCLGYAVQVMNSLESPPILSPHLQASCSEQSSRMWVAASGVRAMESTRRTSCRRKSRCKSSVYRCANHAAASDQDDMKPHREEETCLQQLPYDCP